MASSTVQPKAIFSTRLGRFAPRDLTYPLPPVIARSNGFRQVTDYAFQLRGQYPLQCNQIFHISSLCDYFDRYDIHLQTPGFLAAVLNHIIQENLTNVKDFAYDWSVAHRFELIKLCEPVNVEKIFNTNLIERYGVIFLMTALQHMRNSLAELSMQQAIAKKNIEYGKMAFSKEKRLSHLSNIPSGSGYHELPRYIEGGYLNDRKYRSQRGKGSDEMLSKIDPAMIHNGQSVPSQRSISSPDALQDRRYPSEQHWNFQIRDYAPDFWASTDEREAYQSLRSETQGGRHTNVGWYGGSPDLNGTQYYCNRDSQINSFHTSTARNSDINYKPYKNVSPIANNKNWSTLENLSSNESSPNQIKGSTPTKRSTDSISPFWPFYDNSKPYETGIVVQSPIRTSHRRQSLDTASKWQNNYNSSSLLQGNSNRRLSMGSDFSRPMAFDHVISYKPGNVVLKERNQINQISRSYGLRMTKSRSLNSYNHQGTYLKNSSASRPLENVTSDIATQADQDYFCGKHTIGPKRNDIRTVWVTSIQNATSEELTALFGPCGTVEDIEFHNGSEIASRYAFIYFGSSNEARESLKLHGTVFQDKYLSVQVPRKYWSFPTHSYSKFSPKSNGNNSAKAISGIRPLLPSGWQNVLPPGHINLHGFYPDNQHFGYLGNCPRSSPSQPDCFFSGQGSHFSNGSLPPKKYQSYKKQISNFDIAAGGSAGYPNFYDVGHDAYGIKFSQRVGALAQSRESEMSKEFRSKSPSGFNEKHLMNGKNHNGYPKPFPHDSESTKEKYPRSAVDSNDNSIIDKDKPILLEETTLRPDVKVGVQNESETSRDDASNAVNGDTVAEILPSISTADHKASSDPAFVKSSQFHEQVDQQTKLAFSQINSVAINLTSAKVDNCLDIDPRDSDIRLDNNSNFSELIISESQDSSEKRNSSKSVSDVHSGHTSDILGRNGVISESHSGGQEIEGLAVSTMIQDSQASNSMPCDEIPNTKTPLPKTMSVDVANAYAPTMRKNIEDTSAVIEVSLPEKKLDTLVIASTNTKIVEKQHDPGRTDSIHPFARTKNTKKKGKKISKVTQIVEKGKAKYVKVSKSKGSNDIAKMPLNVSVGNASGTNDNTSKSPYFLDDTITESVVDGGDHVISQGLSASNFKPNKSEPWKGAIQLEWESLSGDHTGSLIAMIPTTKGYPVEHNKVTSANVTEEAHSEACEMAELKGHEKFYSTPLIHEKMCISPDERSAVNNSAKKDTNKVSSLSISGEEMNGIGSKTSSLKKKKKKRSSKSKVISNAQANTQPVVALQTAPEGISKASHDIETRSKKTKAIVELHNGEHENGVAGLGLVVVDPAAASSSSTTSPVQKKPIFAIDGMSCEANHKSRSDNHKNRDNVTPQVSALGYQEDNGSTVSTRVESSTGQVEYKGIHPREESQNADSGSSDNQQQNGNSAVSETRGDEYEGQKEQRPALHVQRVSYAAAAAAMAMAGEMAKAAKRTALCDHSRAVEETLIRLEKLHEKEMMEKTGGGLDGSGSAPALTSTFASLR